MNSQQNHLCVFLLFSPALLTHQIYTVSGGAGNKEIFGLISILVIVYYSQIKNQQLYILGVLFLNISFYIHEINLFLYF